MGEPMTSTTTPRSTLVSLRLPDRIDAHPLDRATVLMALLGIPVGLLGIEVLGFALSGWAWALAASIALLAALTVPLPKGLLLSSFPLLVYLAYDAASLSWTPDLVQGLQVVAKYAAVALVYLVAYRVADTDAEALRKLRTWAFIILPSTVFVYIRALGDPTSTFGWIKGGNSARPMVMSVALLYLMATIGRPRRFTMAVSAVAFLIAAGSGGRMGTAVVGLVILLNPALRLTGRTRVLIFVFGVVLFAAALQFEPIQERFFVGQTEGSIEDIVTLEQNFNTAGRSNNWPEIYAACAPRSTWGFGAGAATAITLEATAGRTGHPHNEYLRTYCESGIVGVALFWSFFIAAGWRGVAAFRRSGSEIGAVAGLSVVALLLFASTDNTTIYTGVFMLPLALILGIADRSHDMSRAPVELPPPNGW